MKTTVVIGGGALGLSVAYHLGRRGANNVVLLERHKLTSGTSWHAAGIVGPLRATPNMTKLAMYAGECFKTLETQTGLSTGYNRTGGYWLAQKAERMDELDRIASLGNYFGLHCKRMSAAQLTEQLPFVDVKHYAGGISVAEDANVNPVDLCMAYAKAARDSGVQIRENSEVADIVVDTGQVSGVRLANGSVIAADTVAVCAGAWSKPLAARAGLELPLQAVEHMYVVTEPLNTSADYPIPHPFPVIRDLDSGIYIKGDSGGKLVIGGFEHNAKCWDTDSDIGQQPFIELPEDWTQFEPFMEAALKLLPQLNDIGVQRFMNGPESFTADTKPLVGMAPTVDGLFVAAGMNSVGIMSSAGIGRVLSDWMLDKCAPSDLWEVDIARCNPTTASNTHMRERMTEAVSDQFDMHWPYKQQIAGRLLHKSVLHDRWQSLGAVFGVTGGLERGLWFARNETEKSLPYSIGRQSWQAIAEQEAAVLNSGVALLDLSAFAKFNIHGKGALKFLQQIASANVDVDKGRAVYTSLLNDAGGIEADVTITRMSKACFRLTSGGATRFRDYALLKRRVRAFIETEQTEPVGGTPTFKSTSQSASKLRRDSIKIDDVTDQEIVLGVMGCGAQALLVSMSPGNWHDFPFGTAKHMTIAGVSCFATRLSYIGEYGFELNMATNQAHVLFDAIVNAGAKPLGQHALNSCRIEKRFLHWGHDIGPEITPLEAGLAWCIDWQKEFVGKAALLKQCDTGVRRRICLFQVEGEPLLLHDEPIFAGNTVVGLTTSGTLGVRTGLSIAIGLVETGLNQTIQDIAKQSFEIAVAGRRYPATVLAHPAYEPENRYARQ